VCVMPPVLVPYRIAMFSLLFRIKEVGRAAHYGEFITVWPTD